MAVPALEVISLREAMESVRPVPSSEGYSVVVRRVQVRHARALEQLLGGFQGKGWRVKNRKRLRKVAEIDTLLTVVDIAVLGDLHTRPTYGPTLRLLQRYAKRIKELSLFVSQDFDVGARGVYEGLGLLAADGLRRHRLRSAAQIEARRLRIVNAVAEVRERIRTFKTRDYALLPLDFRRA